MILYYETEDNTLMHYGIPGMRWGKRKARIVGTDKHRNRGLDDPNKLLKSKKYVTAYQAQKNATKAANEARNKSIAESRASSDKGIGSFQRANRKALNAKRKAYGESINNDKAHNKQLRAEKKAIKKEFKTEVKNAKKHGLAFDTVVGKDGKITQQFYNSKGAKIGSQYANAIMQQAYKEKAVSSLVGTATVLTGAAVVSTLFNQR